MKTTPSNIISGIETILGIATSEPAPTTTQPLQNGTGKLIT